jgi:hypothetical protein
LARRWLPLLAVAALLTAAFVASALADPQFDIRPPVQPQESAGQPTGASAGAAQPTPSGTGAVQTPAAKEPLIPPWVESVVFAMVLMIVLVIVVFLVWYVIRDTIQARGRPLTTEPAPPGPASRVADVAAALDAGLDELGRDGSDPRSVVIACWVRLEEAAAAAGTPRRPSDAPADYVLRLLADHQVSRTVLDRFAGVYRQARYDSGPVDASMRGEAVAALEHLRAELNVGAGA